MFDLFVEAAECDQVFIIVEVDGVLNVLPVLRMLSVGIAVVTHLGRSLETHFSFFLLHNSTTHQTNNRQTNTQKPFLVLS